MTDLSSLTFEQAFSELETLVQQMESGEQDLERTLALFERGMALAAHCNDLLDKAELRVRELAPHADVGDADGTIPFEPSAAADDPW
jgi:exodeoxyribonuclease VII small subunit